MPLLRGVWGGICTAWVLSSLQTLRLIGRLDWPPDRAMNICVPLDLRNLKTKVTDSMHTSLGTQGFLKVYL